ncbi:hypothetical protein P691DRAFT_780597 [Macrolepiota fuliginosa MF-IS2]|uniref:F-box domain-containing protein n=1 Tax=Macrolepiota fuliginosa MF-IS2 TaxID=1400762 RepID=A0A9P5XDJ8_9AGAR|nr:hypothetical protein P691DRAFT_780597 [Macrolepiota fuliginosa MF-IS2]
MVPDLPVELWSEVLSNLPQGTLPNMIGINRYLFETGMNELYEEINLAADMKVGRNPNITSRVRRLHVNATFGPFQPPKPRFNRKVATRIRKWYSRSEKPILSNLLIGVLDGLRRCINLREVTIEVLPGSIMTSVCSEFLDKLAQGLGSRVHVLNVNVEISSWQRHVPIARALTNLTTLKIELHSRFYPLSRREPSLELGVLCIQDLGNLVASTWGYRRAVPYPRGTISQSQAPQIRVLYVWNAAWTPGATGQIHWSLFT